MKLGFMTESIGIQKCMQKRTRRMRLPASIGPGDLPSYQPTPVYGEDSASLRDTCSRNSKLELRNVLRDFCVCRVFCVLRAFRALRGLRAACFTDARRVCWARVRQWHMRYTVAAQARCASQ